jgi:hypothetical protein
MFLFMCDAGARHCAMAWSATTYVLVTGASVWALLLTLWGVLSVCSPTIFQDEATNAPAGGPASTRNAEERTPLKGIISYT